MQRVQWILLILCALFCWPRMGPAQQLRALSIGPQTTVRVPAQWKPSGVKYTNAQELVATGQTTMPVGPQAQPQVVEYPLARTLITTEMRTSHADAVKRLEDIVASRPEPARYVVIGGWPAVEIDFVEALPRRGQGAQADPVRVPRSIIAVAAENRVIQFDISLTPEAPDTLLEEAKQIARSSTFPRKGDPQAVKKSLQSIQQGVKQRSSSIRPDTTGMSRDLALRGMATTEPPTLGTVNVQERGGRARNRDQR